MRLHDRQRKEAHYVGRFDVPDHVKKQLDLTKWAQPLRMVRQGFEETPPAPEAEPGTRKYQLQQTELRVRTFSPLFLSVTLDTNRIFV